MRPDNVECAELMELFLSHLDHETKVPFAREFAIEDLDGRLWCEDELDDCDEFSQSIESVWESDFEFVKCGSSKAVFAVEGLDEWVFKVPLYGMVNYLYDDDTEEGDVSYDAFEGAHKNVEFPLVTKAHEWSHEWDYCETEAVVTSYMEEHYPRLCPLIARTYYIGDIAPGMPLYVSERAEHGYYSGVASLKSDSSTYERSYEKAKFCHHGPQFCREFVALFIDSYGYDEANQMLEVADEIGFNDVYEANLGFDAEGRVHVIDYSGFSW